MFVKRIALFCFAFICLLSAKAQTDTSLVLKPEKVHSPKKASILSAVLPGTGQIYNKKYWKAPVIYAAFGTLGYFYVDNHKNYIHFKDSYKYRIDENPDTSDEYVGVYTDDNLKLLRDYYRRNTELTIIIGFAVYALNIIDAAVDAHLFGFNVSDDLSLKAEPAFSPSLQGNPGWSGIKLTLRF
jgi:hypothetical protein